MQPGAVRESRSPLPFREPTRARPRWSCRGQVWPAARAALDVDREAELLLLGQFGRCRNRTLQLGELIVESPVLGLDNIAVAHGDHALLPIALMLMPPYLL